MTWGGCDGGVTKLAKPPPPPPLKLEQVAFATGGSPGSWSSSLVTQSGAAGAGVSCTHLLLKSFPGLCRARVKWSKVAQSCPTLCDPMGCSLPGSSVHGIFQARVLEWIAISFSRGSSQPRDRIRVSRIVDRRVTVWATREVHLVITCNGKESEKEYIFGCTYI